MRVGADGQREDRRVGRVDLGVDRRRRQVGRQQRAAGVDRGLHLLLGHVERLVERELQRDDGHAGRAGRTHAVQPRHLAELALQRRGDGAAHHLGAGAGVERLHLDGRVVHLRQRRQRQEAEAHQAREHDREHQQRGRDRPLDEGTRGLMRGSMRACVTLAPAHFAGGPALTGARSTAAAAALARPSPRGARGPEAPAARRRPPACSPLQHAPLRARALQAVGRPAASRGAVLRRSAPSVTTLAGLRPWRSPPRRPWPRLTCAATVRSSLITYTKSPLGPVRTAVTGTTIALDGAQQQSAR